jgi:hypothetical protein
MRHYRISIVISILIRFTCSIKLLQNGFDDEESNAQSIAAKTSQQSDFLPITTTITGNKDVESVVSVPYSTEKSALLSHLKYQIGSRVSEYELVDKVDDLGIRNIYQIDDGSLYSSGSYMLPPPAQEEAACDTNVYALLSNTFIPQMSIDAPATVSSRGVLD